MCAGERSSERRLYRTVAAEIEAAELQLSAYDPIHITYRWTGVVEHVPAPHHKPAFVPVLFNGQEWKLPANLF